MAVIVPALVVPSPQSIVAVKPAAVAFGSIVWKVATTTAVSGLSSMPTTGTPCETMGASPTIAVLLAVTGADGPALIVTIVPSIVEVVVEPIVRSVMMTGSVPSSRYRCDPCT